VKIQKVRVSCVFLEFGGVAFFRGGVIVRF
jgi:hypothetical protein